MDPPNTYHYRRPIIIIRLYYVYITVYILVLGIIGSLSLEGLIYLWLSDHTEPELSFPISRTGNENRITANFATEVRDPHVLNCPHFKTRLRS